MPKQVPANIHCAADYAALASGCLDGAVLEHLAGGSVRGWTASANAAAFDRYAIMPRLLRDVTSGHTEMRLPDGLRPHPIMLAPVAHQMLFDPAGEIETARAATATQTCMVCSTLSSCSMEEIAGSAADRWFQLYFQPGRQVTQDLVRRAEAAGYGAIMVTLDAPVQSPSLNALRAGFTVPQAAANLRGYPVPAPPGPPRGGSRILQGIMRTAPLWSDLDWLIRETSLPVWIKGVMDSADAVALLERGASGLVVSNHGGRALDGAPASLSVLRAVRSAVGPEPALLFDGGIRSGADIFKAIALGADGALIGRLQAFGLAVAGALGVAHVVKLLREELELTMALAGCATLADIREAELVPQAGSMSE